MFHNMMNQGLNSARVSPKIVVKVENIYIKKKKNHYRILLLLPFCFYYLHSFFNHFYSSLNLEITSYLITGSEGDSKRILTCNHPNHFLITFMIDTTVK